MCVIDFAIILIHEWMPTTPLQRNLWEVQHTITKKDRKEKILICKKWRETFWPKQNTDSRNTRKKTRVCERDENRSFLSLYMMKMNDRALISQPNINGLHNASLSSLFNAYMSTHDTHIHRDINHKIYSDPHTQRRKRARPHPKRSKPNKHMDRWCRKLPYLSSHHSSLWRHLTVLFHSNSPFLYFPCYAHQFQHVCVVYSLDSKSREDL